MNDAFATVQRTLATIAVRRWSYDRSLLLGGKVTNYKREGWKHRATKSYDARNVRVADFELALQTIPPQAQALILLIHHEGHTWAEASANMGTTVTAVRYQLPHALDALARALERRSLL